MELAVVQTGKVAPPFGALGRNPLFAYMAGGILTLGAQAALPPDSSLIVAWSACLLVLALISAAAMALDAKRIWIKL